MNKNILVIFAILIFTSAPTLAFGEHIKGMLTAEEFSEGINKFARDEEYVRKHVDFVITTHEWFRVYGGTGLANGDREEAIKIFNHPDYPFNIYDMNGRSLIWIDDRRQIDPEFDQMFVHEIVDYKSDEEDLGILLLIDEKYANPENYDRYEDLIRAVVDRELPITFQVYKPTSFSGENSFDFIIPMMSFVAVTSIMIVFLVKKNKI